MPGTTAGPVFMYLEQAPVTTAAAVAKCIVAAVYAVVTATAVIATEVVAGDA